MANAAIINTISAYNIMTIIGPNIPIRIRKNIIALIKNNKIIIAFLLYISRP